MNGEGGGALFDKQQFAALLKLAKGNRSINRFGTESGVDPGYISRLLRALVGSAPSAAVISKLAEHAANGVSVQELLCAAGYLRPLDSSVLRSETTNEIKTIPLIKRFGFDAKQNEIESWFYSYINLPSDFAVRILNNNLIHAGICAGDIAICQRTEVVKPDQWAVLADENGDIIIRLPESMKNSKDNFRPAAHERRTIRGIVLAFYKEPQNITPACVNAVKPCWNQTEWNRVMEEAAKYNIQPGTAIEIIKSIGPSLVGLGAKAWKPDE
jgi:SOS-response transcriptional repressor LexA